MPDEKKPSSTGGQGEIFHHNEAENAPREGGHSARVLDEATARAYWKANLALLLKLLVVWFTVSFGCGILFVDALNEIQFFGFKLGFWFAQQGSIYGFVVLIFIYVLRMKHIERAFGVDDD